MGNTKQELNFEQALDKLEKIVDSLEKGETSLEESISAYEQGMALKKICEEKLKSAQLRVDKITLDGETVHTQPFERE